MSYILLKFRNPQAPDVPEASRTVFIRKDDGMVVGCVAGTIVEFGEDVASVMRRAFIDHASAISWVKAQLSLDPNAFEEREGEPMIQPASRMPPPGVRM